MTPILGFLLVLVIAFLGAIFVFPKINRKNPFISGIAVSGLPYVLLGILLGPKVFSFLSEPVLRQLEPLLSLAFGWVGMLFGIQLRWKNLRRYPRNYMLFTVSQAVLTFLVIAAVAAFSLWLYHPPEMQYLVEAALILAAIGCNSTPITLARTVLIHRARGKLTHMLQFVSSLDGALGIVIAGLLFAFAHPVLQASIQSGWLWFVLMLFLGIILGLLYVFLMKNRFQKDEVMLIVLGLVIFASGSGFYLRMSPIFLCMIIGIVVAQFRGIAEKTMRVLGDAEQPLYLILLIFAGAMWDVTLALDFPVILMFIAARFLGKYVSGWFCARRIYCGFPVPGDVGRVLLSFGGISLAIALNFQLFYGALPGGEFTGNLVVGATLIGTIVFDEYAAWSTPNILRRQGEIS